MPCCNLLEIDCATGLLWPALNVRVILGYVRMTSTFRATVARRRARGARALELLRLRPVDRGGRGQPWPSQSLRRRAVYFSRGPQCMKYTKRRLNALYACAQARR